MNTAELLTITATAFPDQRIVRDSDRLLTYAELLSMVSSTAAILREQGTRAGDRVAVLDTANASVIAATYAVLGTGATLVPLNFRARGQELAHMIELASPTIILAGARYVEQARRAAVTARVVGLETEVHDSAGKFEPVSADDRDLAVLMFTSGTTARAKAVMLGHGQLTRFVLETTEMADGSDHGAVLVAAPLHHIAGLTAVLTATFAGRRIVLMRQFDAAEWLRLAAAEQVTHAFLVPTMLKRVLADPAFAVTDLSTLQVLSYGAAPMPPPVIRAAIERFPSSVQFINAFGQTETTSTVATLSPDDHRLVGTTEEIDRKLKRLASVGRPLPGVEIRILDDDRRQLPPGQVGEIAILTGRAMSGYYGLEAATRETVVDGWLLTRDLGWLDDDGYLFLSGRKSDLIIRGGENVAPEEVEAVIETHPDVVEAGVVGSPDEEWGERIVAVVVRREGAGLTEADVIAYCRERLAGFKKPDRVVFAESLPRTALGKLVRREIQERFARV